METTRGSSPVLEGCLDGSACCCNVFYEKICVGTIGVGQAKVEECILSHAVTVATATCTDTAVIARIENSDEEPAVAAASPAPVHVEEVVAIEAVEHERMSAARREPGEADGIALRNVLIAHIEPIVYAVVAAIASVGTIVVTEILDEDLSVEVRAGGWTIVHVYCLSAVVHQVGNGRVVHIGYLTIFPGICVEHVIPVNWCVAWNSLLRGGFLRSVFF